MAAGAEAVRKWEPVPNAEDNRVWEPVPQAADTRKWEPVPTDESLPARITLTPEERRADEQANRTPANQAELERGIREAPTPQARRLLESERSRIAAPGLPETLQPTEGPPVESPIPGAGAPDAAVQTQLPQPPAAENRPSVGPRPQNMPATARLRLPDTLPARKAAVAPSVGLRPPADLYYDPAGAHAVERRLATDVVPGLVETGVGGAYNMLSGGLASLPASIAAAYPHESDKSSSYLDRFRELQGDIAHRLEYQPRTDTGKVANEYIGKAVEWGLDTVGDFANEAGGPVVGAYVKGASAALLALAGLKGGRGLKPELAIDRTREPTLGQLPDVRGGRVEPPMGQTPTVAEDVVVSGKNAREATDAELAAYDAAHPEPKLPDQLPDVPLSRIEKPRLKGPPGTLGPEQNYHSAEQPDVPIGEKPSTQTEPSAAEPMQPEASGAWADPFDTSLLNLKPAAPEPPVKARPDAEPASASVDELPPAPKAAAAPAPAGPFQLPEPDKSYLVRNVPSNVREGGVGGGKQHKIPQLIHWEKGPSAELDRALFDAGAQFKLDSPDPKIRADAIRNHEAAFNEAQKVARRFFQDQSVPEEVRARYRGLLTEDGTQLDRKKLQDAASGYNVDLSTMLKNARRADEGKRVRVVAPPRGGVLEPTAKGRSPGAGTLSANPVFDPQNWRKMLDLMQGVNRGTQRMLNPAQAMPDHVAPAAAIGYEAARSFYTAREMVQWDRSSKVPDQQGMARDFNDAIAEARKYSPDYDPGPITNATDVLRATERARIRTAERKLQQDLIESGFAVKPTRGEPIPEGFVTPQNYSAFTLPDGRILAIDKDAAPALEQMVSGYDWASERRYYASPGGKWEAISHGLTSSLLLLPTFHAVTAGGRMLPPVINMPKNNLLRFGKSAAKALADRDQVQDMMRHGVTFFPKRQTFDPEGAHVGLIERKMADMGLGRTYGGYQWFHNKVLANSVNWAETMYYQWRLDQLKQTHKGGLSPQQLETYKTMAGRDASMAAANLAKEEAGRGWSRILGSIAFSRGLQVNTVRMATRALEGDKILQAVALRNGLSVEQAKQVMNQNRKFLGRQLIKDYVLLQATANVLNYFTTSLTQEPGGDSKGHFVWENQGSDKSQMILPTNIFVGTSTDKNGKKHGVYVSSPFRSARDVVEYPMIFYDLFYGEKARILRNKASVPIQIVGEHVWTGEDYAGRPLGTPGAAAENFFSHVTPSPFQDVPHYGAEAVRMGSWTYFSEGLQKIFNPETFGASVLGMQPKTLKPNPEVSMLQAKQIERETAVRARASRLKQQLVGMDPEMRKLAIQSIMRDAQQVNMDPRSRKMLRKMLEQEEPGKGAHRQAEQYLQSEPGLRKKKPQ